MSCCLFDTKVSLLFDSAVKAESFGIFVMNDFFKKRSWKRKKNKQTSSERDYLVWILLSHHVFGSGIKFGNVRRKINFALI
jgi:hypothetical protein